MSKTGWLTAVLSALIFGWMTLSGWAIKDRFDTGNKTRQALVTTNQNQNEALRSFLCLFQDTVLANRKLSQKKRDFAIAFFAKATLKIHVPPCPVRG